MRAGNRCWHGGTATTDRSIRTDVRDGGVAETAQFAGTTTKGPSYHFSRSPFARASRSISSASSSSKNMSGLSARSGNTLSKLSVPSAKAFAPAIRNLCVYCLHAIDGTSARWRGGAG